MHQVLQEMDQINSQIVSILQQQQQQNDDDDDDSGGDDVTSTAVASATIVLDNCFAHNRRCLMAYTHNRLKRIREFYRQYGYTTKIDSVLLLDCMAEHEREYLDDYARLITDYNMAVGVDIGSHLHPPRDYFVRVKALRDHGEISTATGSVRLVKDNVYVMREADADPLITERVVRVVTEN